MCLANCVVVLGYYQFVIVIKTLKISRSRNLSLLLSGSFHFSFFVFWTKTKKSAVLFLDGNVITASNSLVVVVVFHNLLAIFRMDSA